MHASNIVTEWKEGLVSTGEALMQIVLHLHDTDEGKFKAISEISLILMEYEKRELEECQP